MKPVYGLSQDVFSCIAASRIVFLDLRQNRYLCLRREDSAAVRRPLGFPRWSTCSELPCEGSQNHRRTQRILSVLLRHGLIEPVTTTARPGIAQINMPTVSVASSATEPDIIYTHHHVRRFALAALASSWNLRLRSMQRTVNRVKMRKHRGGRSRTGELPELLAIFERLRPLYGRRYVCLYDSLALLEFLARHGHFADWIFGVKVEPFGAHCWLQYQDQLLNDSVDYVRNFTPIMVV